MGTSYDHVLTVPLIRVQPKLTKDGTIPREFSDYTVTVDSVNLPQGVTLERKVG